MDAAIKTQWLDDLRSGNFNKGKGVLHRVIKNEDGTERHEFCCLGVLCEQAVAAGVLERHDVADPDSGDTVSYGDDYDTTYLPLVVRDWAGIDSHSPVLSNGDHVAILNDEVHDEFGPIADAIENDAEFGAPFRERT